MRVQKFLRDKKVGSIRHCDELVKRGSILINEINLTDPTYYLKIGDRVKAVGKEWIYEPISIQHRYYLFHKPIKVLSTHRDSSKRKIIFDYFSRENRDLPLYYAGRLDYLSRGLMIISSDGKFIHQISHPSKNQAKEYRVTTKYPIDYRKLKHLSNGFTFRQTGQPNKQYSSFRYHPLHTRQVTIVLHQGLNRQVRNIMATSGNEVSDIFRTKIGRYSIGQLGPGDFLTFTPHTTTHES